MLQIQNFSTQIILVNNAMMLEEDDQTTFTARLQLTNHWRCSISAYT